MWDTSAVPHPLGAHSPPSTRAAVVAGVGAHVPSTVVTNDDLAARLDTSGDWIVSRTGIHTRHVAAGLPTSDLAVRAGADALRSAGLSTADAVVLATSTPDRPVPATAPAVASALGMTGVPAFDIDAVCSGFVYGLAVAAGLIATSAANQVLLIGADTFSTIVDPADRATAPLFGDGAGAIVLRAGTRDEPGALLDVELGSDGTLEDLITVRAGGSRHPDRTRPVDPADLWFAMQGQAVYRHAVTTMAKTARTVLDRTGWRVEDVDRFVGHQANLRILKTIGTELGIEPDRVYANVSAVGNTVAASIPLALTHAHASGELTAGDRVLLTAFGGGATWGAATLVWPELTS